MDHRQNVHVAEALDIDVRAAGVDAAAIDDEGLGGDGSVGLDGLQTENLNQCAGFLVEVQTCLNDFRVVENHEGTGLQVVWKGGEMCFTDLSVLIHQQLGLVADRQRKFSDAFIRQRIVVVANLYMFCFFHVVYFFAKVQQIAESS